MLKKKESAIDKRLEELKAKEEKLKQREAALVEREFKAQELSKQ